MLRIICFTILTLGSLLLASCRKQIDADEYDFEERLCVNAMLIADNNMKVHVSMAQKMGNSQLPTIENAQVFIYHGDENYMLTHEHSGIYSAIIPVMSNTSYACIVNVDGKIVTANCKIPEKPKLLSVRINPGGWIDEEGIPMPLFELQLDNTANDTLYYEVYVYSYSRSIVSSVDTYVYDSEQSAGIFSFESKQADSFTKQIRFWRNTWGSNQTYAYVLEIRALNKDAYLYFKSKDIYDLGRFPDFGVSSPVAYNTYNNIANGTGIFAGYSTVVTDTLYEIKPTNNE